jgi:hypothetical protein
MGKLMMIDKTLVFEKNIDKLQFPSTTSTKFKEDLCDYFKEDFLDKKVLEIGTHHGYGTRFLSFFFKKVYTIDNSSDCISKARKFCIDRNNIEFWEGDLYNKLVYFEVEPREQGIMVPGIFDELPKDIDVVFIDASHLYNDVIIDTINVISKFKNPILIFDDYGAEYPVRKAVDDLIKLGLLDLDRHVGHVKGDKIKNKGEVSDYLNSYEGIICRRKSL